jgi:uncharacterized membrane protein YjjB (DUF3815 family)
MERGTSAREIVAKLANIEAARPRFSTLQTAAGVGAACGGFAFLNAGTELDVIAASIGGGIGQWLRAQLLRRRYNQYGAAALCAVAASSSYLVIAAALALVGLGPAHHSAGFISSVLFLIPGFPLVAALLDLLEHQTGAAVTRVAYSVTILLAATLGLSIVIGIAGIAVQLLPPAELAVFPKLLLRAIASFVGGCGFAILYNSSMRCVFAVGVLALGANELRLGLHDTGMMLAPATFFGALAVGLVAPLVHRRISVPRIAITVPGIIVMVPGLYAFEMIVQLNQGQMLEALHAAGLCGFVIGAMAAGLAAARYIGGREDIGGS